MTKQNDQTIWWSYYCSIVCVFFSFTDPSLKQFDIDIDISYLFISYIIFLFLHFLFFLPYVFIRISWYLDIDFFYLINSKAFEEVFFSYMCCFLRNDLDVYLTIVSLWFLFVISDTIIKYRKKSAENSRSHNST
jgi:hypothetical protein